MRKCNALALVMGLSLVRCLAAQNCGDDSASAKPAALESIRLSTNSATDYGIFVAADATAAEKHAADELAGYLKQVTGAPFAIVHEIPEQKPVLAVGAGAAGLVSPGIELKDLGNDGIVLRTVGRNVVLTGGHGAARGTLYAVYTFLEDSVGVRWWTPGVADVPSHPTLTIEPRDVRYVPPLEYRDPFMKCAFDAEFAVHNKINGPYRELDEAHGSHIAYAGFVHTFYDLVPPAKHFKTHPEWYSEIGGKRTSDRAQLCLTNKELRDFVLKRAREWAVNNPETYLRDGPAASIISISQNDWLRRCECSECLKVEAEEGSPSGPLLRFVNSIAADMEHDFPNVAIDTLAYMYTRKPPTITRPRPNVIVRLCSIECSFLQPLDSDVNASFRDDIVGWSKICKRLYVWDYVTNFSNYLAPHPDLRVLAPNIRFFVDHGVKGILEQGNNRTLNGEWEELRAWVLAKLLWNPQLDANVLIDEFLAGYYGKAAPKLRAYINLLHDRAEPSGYYLKLDDELKAPYLTTELLTDSRKLLQEAADTVVNDDVLKRRVERVALAPAYIFAVRWPCLRREVELAKQPWPITATREDLIATIARLSGSEPLFEDFSGDTTPQIETFSLKYGGRTVPARPQGFENVASEDFIDFQDECAQLWGRPKKANWVVDPQASDGKAAWMPGDHAEWDYYMLLNDPTLKAAYNDEWDAYAAVRIEKTGNAGAAFSCGIYDPVAKRDSVKIDVAAADIDGQSYHVYKVGRLQPKPTDYFWAAPANNGVVVQGVYVDRFFLVRAKK
jgi:hypothetical protein